MKVLEYKARELCRRPVMDMIRKDLRYPSVSQMVSALMKAAEDRRWNHLRKDFEKHRGDWVESRDIRKPLTTPQYLELPEVLAEYSHVRLCTYLYYSRTVWGFYAERLPFKNFTLSQVGVAYDPIEGEIIHCMRVKLRAKYFERHQEFVNIRW